MNIKLIKFLGIMVLIFSIVLQPVLAQSEGNNLLERAFGGFGGDGFVSVIASIFLGIFGLGLAVFFVWWIVKRRKNWNMKVEFRIPRDVREDKYGNVQGTIIKEWGKGFYDAKSGVALVKRKGKKAVPMKPFDVKVFLSSGNVLTVIQTGAEDYRPVFEQSYLEVKDYETGQEGALIKAKIDTSESKSWRNQFEREAKSTYTIRNFLALHGDKLVWGLVVLIVLIGQAIVITRLR